jgi:hypothetical protein
MDQDSLDQLVDAMSNIKLAGNDKELSEADLRKMAKDKRTEDMKKPKGRKGKKTSASGKKRKSEL